MPIDRNAMALYVSVVESGSFSKAAVHSDTPVSTVSRKISELEQALGVRLLERSTRQLRMTEIGQDYFELCRRGMQELAAADALITQRKVALSGRLRLSVPPTMSDLVVLPLVRTFLQRYPAVEVHCFVSERFVDHIADGIDVALRVGQMEDSSVVAVAVSTHRPRLVGAPAYVQAQAAITEPQQLAPHVYVAFSRWGKPLQWVLTRNKERARITPTPKLVLNDYAGVQQGVLDGMGISEVPWFICQAALAQGQLVEVLADWQFESHRVTVAYPSKQHLSPVVAAFRDFCIAWFAAHPLG